MTETHLTEQELEEVLTPILSLVSKSQKAIQKLKPQTWQYSMLQSHIAALQFVTLLIQQEPEETMLYAREDDIEQHVSSMSSMVNKTERALNKLVSGTAQHSLLQRRLHSLRMATTLLLERCGGV